MTLVAGLRAIETSFDDARSTFVIQGELEFGTVNAGMQIRLPLPSGKRMQVPVHSVEVVQDSFGMRRLAVGILIPDGEARKALQALTLVGHDLQVVQTAGKVSDGNAFQGTCAVLGLLILAAAFFLPVAFGGEAVTGQGVAWQIATAVIFIGALALIRESISWSLLVLLFSCAFFFVSCASNFKLHMT